MGMGHGAETLLQSPASCRTMVSCFPRWCNHKTFLPVGLRSSLADKAGLGALLLRPRDSVLLQPWPVSRTRRKGFSLPWQRGYHHPHENTNPDLAEATSPRYYGHDLPSPLWSATASPCLLHSPGSPGSHATLAAQLRLVQRADTHTSHPALPALLASRSS